MKTTLTFELRDAGKGAEFIKDRKLDKDFSMEQGYTNTWEFETPEDEDIIEELKDILTDAEFEFELV